jgi:tetratricopeptide (TPR) repeat protein
LEHVAGFENYESLARTYADAGKVDEALVEYRHALELEPGAASVYDAMALLLWKAGRHEDAVKAWQIALDLLRKQIDLQAVPNEFFTTTELVARHAKQCGAVPQVRANLNDLFKAYLAKNGTYRSNELLLAAFDAAGNSADGVTWILDLSGASKQQAQILADLRNSVWLPRNLQPRLYLKRLELARSVARNSSEQASSAEEVVSLQEGLAVLYTDLKEDTEAKSMLAQIPEDRRQDSELLVARVSLAARDGGLKALLEAYDAMPDGAQPAASSLHAAANRLVADGDEANARLVLEYLFERSMLRHQLTGTDYLALADARIKTGDLPGALDLLRRMTLLPSDQASSVSRYTNDDLAARLLEKADHPAEAIPFLKTLAAGQPWNTEYGLRLAEAQLNAGQDAPAATASLAAMGRSTMTPYELRARAAMDLRSDSAASLGSVELDLLAKKTVVVEAARRPYASKARMAAAGLLGAKATADARQQEALLREALAIEADGTDSDAIRIGIFHAEAALGQNALAISAIKPLISRLEGTVSSAEVQDEDAAQVGAFEAVSPIATSVAEDLEQRATLLAAISDISWKMGDSANSLQYLQTAARLAPKSPRANSWRQKLAERQTVIRRARTNATRRPVVHNALDQSIAVRPRLVAAKESR